MPPHIRRLLESPLDSFEKLEIVTALVQAAALTTSVRELVDTTDLPIDAIEEGLEDLAAANIVQRADGLVRLSATSVDASAVRDLVELYEADRVVVARVLSERSLDRIRGMAAQAFAVAFGPRKKPGDDH